MLCRCREVGPTVSACKRFCLQGSTIDVMGETTTIRISRETHASVTRLATERHETIDETVSRAIRALRQDTMARDLASELTDDEIAWLDADAG